METDKDIVWDTESDDWISNDGYRYIKKDHAFRLVLKGIGVGFTGAILLVVLLLTLL